jgi:hypothetical protein
MTIAEYLLHLSNVLMLVAYSVRDILWLRVFAVGASVTAIPYYVFREDKLWPPLMWSLVFMTINLLQIVRLWLERRPVTLSDDERTLYDMAFRALRPREFVSLLLAGEWKTATPGEEVLTEGQPVGSVCIPISGHVRVRTHGRDVATLEPGHVIGTALALTGEPSPVQATFTDSARYMCWPLQSLRSFVDKRPELRTALQGLVNHDLARKLQVLLPTK